MDAPACPARRRASRVPATGAAGAPRAGCGVVQKCRMSFRSPRLNASFTAAEIGCRKRQDRPQENSDGYPVRS